MHNLSRTPRIALALILTLAALIAGCGGSGSGSGGSAGGTPSPSSSADVSLLFMGNSHTSFNDLPGMVAAMIRAARPGTTVYYVEAPGWMFLEERATHGPSLQLLERNWSHVVLQAQKYSMSGLYDYPTAGAESLVRMARTARAVPILFPEWPLRGINEAQRIYDLHVSIARREPACVAPIGQAWDLALARYPAMALYAADGNHSAPAGAFLAALVIATTISGVSPDQLPFLEGFDVEGDVQARLRGVAAETVLVYRPREWCPADP